MHPFVTFTDLERADMYQLLDRVDAHPYDDFQAFAAAISELPVPNGLAAAIEGIAADRAAGASAFHVLRNCPVDEVIPVLENDDPAADKHARKNTFVAEAFLAMVARLAGTPLLAYQSRNRGDFFTDVIAINKYHGMQTGFSDSELVYHNDRTAHDVRADYISLLGMRVPPGDLVYTGFIDGRTLLGRIPGELQAVLRGPYFVTPFDVYSRDTNQHQTVSEPHPILENEYSFRFLDGTTTVLEGAPEEAKDALIAMLTAVVRAEKLRYRIETGDLAIFANQNGLHNRERVEINDPKRARNRWLLKTYAFRDEKAARVHMHRWAEGVPGLISD
jgi:L-asparagine oxygenase